MAKRARRPKRRPTTTHRARRPAVVAPETESARLERVRLEALSKYHHADVARALHDRAMLALDRASVDYLKQGAGPRRATSEPLISRRGLPPRRRGPRSTLSDAVLAKHRAEFPPGAPDKTGQPLSRNARAKMLGVSRDVLRRRAPDLHR